MVTPISSESFLRRRIDVFIQAPADVCLALTLYEHYSTAGFRFFIMDGLALPKFLAELNLSRAELIRMPVRLERFPRSPLGMLALRRALSAAYDQYFNHFPLECAYFFSNYYDALTAYFVSRLAERGNCHVRLIYNYTVPGSDIARCLKARLASAYMYLVSGHRFQYVREGSHLVIKIPLDGMEEEALQPDWPAIAKYRTPVQCRGRGAVLVENHEWWRDRFPAYEETIRRVVECLRRNAYVVYVKPHPRLGYSRFLDELGVEFLPREVPFELLECEGLRLRIGVNSCSLFKAPPAIGETRISIVRMLRPFRREDELLLQRDIKVQERAGVQHPGSFEEFSALVEGLCG